MGLDRTTAVVTGAAGFLGSHLVDRLLAEGFEVVGLDNLETGDLANLSDAGRSPHFHLEIGDVRDGIPARAPLIFNLACPASPVHYQADPLGTLTTSVLGAIRLVEAVRGRRCRVVHASTSEVYGDPLVHPQREDYWGNVNPVGGRACYDEGKRAAETYLSDARRVHGADARIVRIFNTYGPRMALNDGRVVSNFLSQALRGEALTIYGTGEQSRSFCFVDDLIEGLVRLALEDAYEGPVNMGNPAEFTMAELAATVQSVVGSALPLKLMPLPEDDPRQRCPDISRAARLYGFGPFVTLRDGLEVTARDFLGRMAARWGTGRTR
jgi:UDP-glucuronate decarboxylase